MSLLAEMRNAEDARRGPRCSVTVVLESMNDEDAADLRAALGDPTITGSVIARILRNRGHRITEQSVTRHRRGACLCPGS